MYNKKRHGCVSGGTRGRRHGVTRAPSWLSYIVIVRDKCYIPAAERPTPSQAIRHDFATSITVQIMLPSKLEQEADKSRLASLGFSLGGTQYIKEWAETWRERLSEQNRASVFPHYFTIPIFFIVTYVFIILKRYRTGNLLQN
jgi:hypothetical protein